MATTITRQGVFTPSAVDLTASEYNGENSPFSNAYGKGSDNEGDYAEWGLVTGSQASTYVCWAFDLSSIPSNATITNVTCAARCSNTTSTIFYVSNASVAIGTTDGNAFVNKVASANQAFGTTATVVTVESADYTREELDNFRLKIQATRGFLNTSASYYTKFYGATLTIDYEEPVEVNKYTVRFLDYNGNVLDTQTIEEGSDATPPNNPTREGYNFTGWSGSYTNITADTDITAQYSIKTFTVRFLNWDNSVIDTQIINYGSDATPPNNPTRTGYTFNGWSGSYTNITANTDIKATYIINRYTVRFLDYNNDVLDTQTIEYNNNATPPSDPVRDGYRFTGWLGTYTNITQNTDITAQYVKIYNIVSSTTDPNAGSITPSTSVDEGGSKTFIITAKPGYKVKSVKIDGIDQGAITSYTFTDVNSDHTIEVEFEVEPTVVAAIEINKMYTIKLIEGEGSMSVDLVGLHVEDIYEDLSDGDSIYLDENGILHVYELLENLAGNSSHEIIYTDSNEELNTTGIDFVYNDANENATFSNINTVYDENNENLIIGDDNQ